MMILSRKKNESIVINNDIIVTVVEVRGDKVRLGIVAPREVSVSREEIYDAIYGCKYPAPPVSISPSLLAWKEGIIPRLAKAVYDERILPAGKLDNTRLAILADALEEAGCTDEQMLSHLRSGGEHYRSCFVLDALLGKG